MGFKKDSITREEWIFEYKEHIIPLQAIKSFLQVILVCVLAYFTFTLGQYFASEYYKVAFYLSGPHCDLYGHCTVMKLVVNGNQIQWVEEKSNQTTKTPVNISNGLPSPSITK